jgi:homeobox protein cut-like
MIVAAGAAAAAGEASSGGMLGAFEARYQKEYEAKLNPFAEFQANESEAARRGMRLHDKALLAAGRLIAGSRLARAGLALYFFLVHVFLMVLMYHSASPHVTLQQAAVGSVVGAAAAAGGAVEGLAAARLAAAGAGVGTVGSGEAVPAAAGSGAGGGGGGGAATAGLRLLLWGLQ